MKTRYIILPFIAAAMLSSCSDDDDRIFDQSAAERLEAGRKNYTQALSAEGGVWEMQYFSNSDEPGYIFVCEFEPDGSVTMHTDHMWIDNRYASEKSLWEVISDDGNVLTFNSYNTLFHIFSTPENITGPNAPTNDGKDINELGYGHNGDYEFLLMGYDGVSMRLIGKKRGLEATLTRLPEGTDPEEYLAALKAQRSVFSSKFPTLCLTEETSGARYDVTGMAGGVPTVVPFESTSPNSRTVKGNGIFTTEGFRFMEPLEVIREDNSAWTLTALTWDEDGSLVARRSDDNSVLARISAQAPGLNLQNARLTWLLDKESMSPALAAAHDAASASLQAAAGSRFDLRNISFGYFANKGKTYFSLTTYAGTRVCRDFCEFAVNPEGTEASIAIVDSNKAAADFVATAPAYVAFKQMLCGDFTIENAGMMNPNTIIFTSKSNPEVSFSVNVQ